MASLEEIRDERLKKLNILKERGLNPYPSKVDKDYSLSEVLEKFDDLGASPVKLVGRVMAVRGQGAVVFINLFDGTATLQGLLKKDNLSEETFSLFSEVVDIGDFIGVTGTLFITSRGEKTVEVTAWTMLSKSLRPLPEKWHGLQDTEEKLRRRYLDILMNPEVRETIELKARFWQFIRNFLITEGFIEVETPTLELTTGGAEATPFKTHHNDYDLDVFLRISVGELWQKKLLAGGLPKVFEIGRVYRNEGTSPDHVQEFTNLEFYAAYFGLEEGINFTEKMLSSLVSEVFGKTAFTARGFNFDLAGAPWPRISYVEKVEEMTGINVLTATETEMKNKLDDLKVKYEGDNRERLIDTLWKYCRKQIAGPAWLVDHPKLVSPLSKAKVDNPEVVERAQLILAGTELTNGFAELNDPAEQEKRFLVQQALLEGGDSEAMMPDFEFVEMLEYGMPPAFGNGFGDRLFAFLVDKPLRETQIFPLMRPKK